MTYIKTDIYKAVIENDLDNVIFQDPFSGVTRKARRNLLVASFACLLIAALKLQVTGFLGFQAAKGTVGNDLARGIGCIIVLFLTISFIFHAFIDYSAWQFYRERQLTKPYLDLISMIHSHIDVTAEQVKNAVQPLNRVSFENDMQAETERIQAVWQTQSQLESIDKRLEEVTAEITPLLASWRTTIEGMDRLNLRHWARFISLWILDIALPIVLGVLAIFKSFLGIHPLLLRLLS